MNAVLGSLGLQRLNLPLPAGLTNVNQIRVKIQVRDAKPENFAGPNASQGKQRKEQAPRTPLSREAQDCPHLRRREAEGLVIRLVQRKVEILEPNHRRHSVTAFPGCR